MKKLFIFVVFISHIAVNAQNNDTIVAQKQKTDNVNKIANKIYSGGNFGIAINSNQTNIILEPMLGYKQSDRIYFGTKFTYRHSRIYTWKKKTSNDYGGSIFAQFYALPFFYFHIEPAFMNYQYSADNSIRKTVPFIWVGNGIRRKTSKYSWVTAQILFDIYNHKDSPYYRWQPFITVGVGFSL